MRWACGVHMKENITMTSKKTTPVTYRFLLPRGGLPVVVVVVVVVVAVVAAIINVVVEEVVAIANNIKADKVVIAHIDVLHIAYI